MLLLLWRWKKFSTHALPKKTNILFYFRQIITNTSFWLHVAGLILISLHYYSNKVKSWVFCSLIWTKLMMSKKWSWWNRHQKTYNLAQQCVIVCLMLYKMLKLIQTINHELRQWNYYYEVDGSHLGQYTRNTKTNFRLKISQQTHLIQS